MEEGKSVNSVPWSQDWRRGWKEAVIPAVAIRFPWKLRRTDWGARRPQRQPRRSEPGLETQETLPSEGPRGWVLGMLHTVILDVENPSSVT